LIDSYIPSRNPKVKQIEESLKLAKNLYLSVMVMGEKGVGKRRLVREIFPNLPWGSGEDLKHLKQLLSQEQELIIENFELIKSLDELELDNKRIIAISDIDRDMDYYDSIFAFIYKMPPLKERPEDYEILIDAYVKRAKELFCIKSEIDKESLTPDLSGNFNSFRSSILRETLLMDLSKEELKRALYLFFIKRLDKEGDYKENLALFERPLLEAGLKIYGSQLKLAKALGINRNTLRKRLNEYKID